MMASRMGFRFRPSDEELVDPYLKKKIYDRDFSVPRIQELDISKIEPWDLPQQYPNPPKDNVWYFYCLPSRYGHSKHTSRKTTAGSWKITARDRIIKARNGSRKVIGVKKTLTFYEGRKDSGRGKKATKPIKTNWVMNEFHYLDIPPGKKPYVICRIKIKQDDKHNSTNKVSSSQLLASNVRSKVSANPILELGPSLISQSEIFNEVSGTDHDFSSVNQSSVHPQQESVNYMLTNNTSPDEGQSRCHHLASNYEDDGLELEFPLPEVDAWRHEEFGAYNNYNGLGHNYFVTKQPPIHSELGPLNTQGFIVHGKSNSPFGNQIELGDDLTNSLWASQNSNYVCQAIGTGPPNINLLYSANGVRIGGDYSHTDTETINPWVKDYSAQNDGEYYSCNPQPVSIWDCGYFY